MKKNKMTKDICIASTDTVWGSLRIPGTRLPIECVYSLYQNGYSIKYISTKAYPQISIKEVKRLIDWWEKYLIPMVYKAVKKW